MKNTKQSNPRRQNGLFRGGLKGMGTILAAVIGSLLLGGCCSHPKTNEHGLVGLRPLSRTAELDHGRSHGGSWDGTPTYAEQTGNYPFVAEHIDVIKNWLDGDFKTKRVFFEHYWGLSEERDDLDPQKNLLIQTIRKWEEQGGTVEHILIAREYKIAIKRGAKDAKPGPFPKDTRLLYEEDVTNIRQLFKDAHAQGLVNQDNYKLIMMVGNPSFFVADPRVHPLIEIMDGVAYECHQFNAHWPLATAKSRPERLIPSVKWTLAQDKEFILYFGPINWKGDTERYYEFMERDWLETYWAAGMPKHHPNMHYYLNTFPYNHGRFRPIGPESDPHSVLGFTKWLIEEI